MGIHMGKWWVTLNHLVCHVENHLAGPYMLATIWDSIWECSG
jgi:hypothetical protein